MLIKLLLIFSPYLPISLQISETTSLCKEKKPSGRIPVGISPSSGFFAIYKQDGSLQCDLDSHSGSSLQHMKKELQNSGVKVYRSVTGRLINIRAPSLCGSPTSKINIYYVQKSDLSLISKKGFKMCSKKNLSLASVSNKEDPPSSSKKQEALALSIDILKPSLAKYGQKNFAVTRHQEKQRRVLSSTIPAKKLPSFSPTKEEALIVSFQDLDIF